MIHRFKPTRYYNTLGWHEPALQVNDGDTVITTTIDAFGNDENDKFAWQRGNPMSGPFHVAGANPGDTLAVHIDKIKPNRRTGYTYNVVAANVLDPDYVRQMPKGQLVEWDVDVAKKKVTLRDPGHDSRVISHKSGKRNAPNTKSENPQTLSIPLTPMLGCFGVAPERQQAISTATSGTHGGNMDYNGWMAGVTAYFPVFAEGALFHLGDVHAVQGDGEIVGTGIEISAEVQFTVRVIKGKTIGWPRGENRDFIWAVGNARPLDQCVQHATTEMLRWLQSDYGLSARYASTLLGQCVKYDLGNIFDPAFTMVCRVAKRYLG